MPYPSSEEVTSYDATPFASVPAYWTCSGDGAEAVAAPPCQLSVVAAPKVMIPGAPPVSVLSLTAIRTTPFSANEI